MVKDSNVVLEIPAAATIAYGVIELYVKQDGQFGECHPVLVHAETPHLFLGSPDQGPASRARNWAEHGDDPQWVALLGSLWTRGAEFPTQAQ